MAHEPPSQWRLLFLLPFPPRLDATHGGSRTVAQLLVQLATRHRIAVIYLRAPTDPPLDPTVEKRCERVEEVRRPHPGFSFGQAGARLRSLLRGWPLWVAGCSVAAYGSQVRSLAKSWRPHIVQIEYHVMGQYLEALDDCAAPRLLVQHEPGASAARDLWRASRGWARAIRYLDMLAWERFESMILRRVQAVVVFTERDQKALEPLCMPPSITRISPGTGVPDKPLDPLGQKPWTLLFIGNFIHPPNLDAALRLICAIAPQVEARVPGIVVRIVGDKPPAQLVKLAKANVMVTGRVPEVRPYLDQAAVIVAPLRMGGGMRIKVLEALAAGKAVVASPLAAEGLDVVHGTHLMLARSDQEFIDAIVLLLLDPAKRASLAENARAWACVNLGWERSLNAYGTLYESLICHHR